MICSELARELREAGLAWNPTAGDAFLIDGPELQGDVFTVSDMTIEPHEFDTGTILGFNGTTEWALDSIALEDSLWLPREEQLRGLLDGRFRSLSRLENNAELENNAGGESGVAYRVDVFVRGEQCSFTSAGAADAYALALLAVIALSPVQTQ